MAEQTFASGDAVTITDDSLVFAGQTGRVVAVDPDSGDVTVAVPRLPVLSDEGVVMAVPSATAQHVRYPAAALAPAAEPEQELKTDPGDGQSKYGIDVPADGVEREHTLEGTSDGEAQG